MKPDDVAVVAFAQSPCVRNSDATTNGVEMLVPLFAEVFASTGLTKSDIGFWCSGSSDYLAGRAFSFISAIDAIGAFPPINESHVEMDAAWALYEAWVKIRTGEVETALVYGFGKSSAGHLRRVLSLQLDPYLTAPLWPDSLAVAGIQARLGLESGRWSEQDMAAVAARCLGDATGNPYAQQRGHYDIAELMSAPYLADPLRAHDIAPVTDGASVVVLAAANRAADLAAHPAVLTGIEHRIDSAVLGARDLTRAESIERTAEKLDLTGIEIAELHTPFSHQELIVRDALGLTEEVRFTPSGGALVGNPMFAGGLARIGEAAGHILRGGARKVLAHATNGPVLQQNLVAVLEAA